MSTIPLHLVAKEAPPPWLVQDFSRSQTLNLISADPYTGKTLLCLYFILCMEFQRPLFGIYSIPRVYRSVLIAQDSPRWDIAGQLRKLAAGLGISEHLDLMDSLLWREKFSLMNPKDVQLLAQECHEKSIDCIWLDTLLAAHYEDENDNRKMGLVLDVCKLLRDQGFTIFMTHHLAKPMGVQRTKSQQARGATSIIGGIDYHYALRRTHSGNTLLLSLEKGRGHDAFSELRLALSRPETTLGDAAITISVETPKHVSVVMEGLPASRSALLERLRTLENIPASKAPKLLDNTLQALRRSGKIVRELGVWRIV